MVSTRRNHPTTRVSYRIGDQVEIVRSSGMIDQATLVTKRSVAPRVGSSDATATPVVYWMVSLATVPVPPAPPKQAVLPLVTAAAAACSSDTNPSTRNEEVSEQMLGRILSSAMSMSTGTGSPDSNKSNESDLVPIASTEASTEATTEATTEAATAGATAGATIPLISSHRVSGDSSSSSDASVGTVEIKTKRSTTPSTPAAAPAVTTTTTTTTAATSKLVPTKKSSSRRVKASLSTRTRTDSGRLQSESVASRVVAVVGTAEDESVVRGLSRSATGSTGTTKPATPTVVVQFSSSQSKTAAAPMGVLATRHGRPVTKYVMHTGVLYISTETRRAEFVRTK